MLHHLSIGVKDPEHVADVLSELMGGQTFVFPHKKNSYYAVQPDPHGTNVEVYPSEEMLMPEHVRGTPRADSARGDGEFTSVHFALSVDKSPREIEAIAEREGWECKTYDRAGHFHVVVIWIENRLMVELLPPEYAQQYLNFITVEWLDKMAHVRPRA